MLSLHEEYDMRFIFVHGGWHGGWCWKPLSDFLENHGHDVECIDLPGHGDNKTPLKDVTYKHYSDALESSLRKAKTPPIVVSHSMSGTVAAPLLEKFPELFSHLYFIASYLPKKGQSLIEMARSFNNSDLHLFLQEDKKNNAHAITHEGAKKLFYHDCPEDFQNWALTKIQPQPVAPLDIALNLDGSEMHSTKRTYIICEKDKAVNPISQREIVKHYACKTVSIDAGHFPFISKPKELAEILFGD